MAINLGLSAADRRAYLRTLRHTHRIRALVRIHNGDEKIVNTISPSRLIAGGVHVDTAETPRRTAEVTLLQPAKAPAWLPDSPSDAAVFANNFLSIVYGVWVDDLSDGPGWVNVPLFWGQVTGVNPDGRLVTIQAQGKEILGLDPHLLWDTLDIRRGVLKTTAIRRMLAARGETRFDMPQLRTKLGKDWSLGYHAQVWNRARALAGGMNRQIFYDGRGRVRIRRLPQNRVFSFKDGDGGTVLSRPQLSFDLAEARNLVEVLGPEPKGPPKRIRATSRTHPTHPLAPHRLKRNGVPRYMVDVVDGNMSKPEFERRKGKWRVPSGVKNPDRWRERRSKVIVKRQRQAQRIADNRRRDAQRVTVDVQFECLPIPHLEEGDLCAVQVDGQNIPFRMRQFSIPLVGGESMSVGTNKRFSFKKRRRKKKRGKR